MASKLVTIGTKEFEWDELSQEAQALVASVQFADKRIKELEDDLKIIRIGRAAYLEKLMDLIE